MTRKYPSALLWVDIESPCLPNGNDFSGVPIMEIAGVVTDFDLNKFTGFHEHVKLTREHVDILKENPEVADMHKKSGLLVDCSKSDKTVADLEAGMIDILKDSSFEKGEFIIAGSGVARFDYPLLLEKMPELASWLTYYPMDIGVLRRAIYYLGHRREFIETPKASFKDGYKKHRAYADVLAHIEEAERYKDWLRALPERGE